MEFKQGICRNCQFRKFRDSEEIGHIEKRILCFGERMISEIPTVCGLCKKEFSDERDANICKECAVACKELIRRMEKLPYRER